jgi:aminoglycoside phosphotransferase (APT) family kinase protein
VKRGPEQTRAVEQKLAGGAQTSGVVRVGATVRRPLHVRSDYVHRLLGHLEQVGFAGAPRFLGIDGRGREVLTYFEGEVLVGSPIRLSDERIISASRLIQRFHDATAGTVLVEEQEIVAHNDLGPHNIVFDGDEAVGIIDWDDGVAPGRRLVDFAHAVWCCADVCEPEVEVAEQARKTRLMCETYGRFTQQAVIDEITARFHRARADHARHGRDQGAVIFAPMVRWMEVHSPALKAP